MGVYPIDCEFEATVKTMKLISKRPLTDRETCSQAVGRQQSTGSESV